MAEQQEAAVLEAGRDSAFAATLDIPGMYTKWMMYSEMNARWCCWRPDNGGDTLVRADSSGLWSVHVWKGLPSRQEWKCLIPEKAASSSLSKGYYSLPRI
jgi:hypothetical protein